MAVQYQFTSSAGGRPPALPEEETAMLRYFLSRRIVLPEVETPDVSIIIPVFNQYRYTIACLQSLVGACAGTTTYEVILADDNSTDETRELGDRVENLRVIKNTSDSHGFLPNVNFAAKYARGKYLFLLNNDTLLLDDGGLLDRMTSHFLRDDVGAVGCRLLRADGSLYDCGRVILVGGYLMNASPPKNMMNAACFESDLVEGSAMMVRSCDWRDLGGFDPVFGKGYFEESDLCLKLKTQKNLRILTDLQSCIIHFGSRSFGKSEEKNQLFFRNAQIFIAKWHDYLAEREAGLTATDAPERAAQLWKKLYSEKVKK